MADKNHTAFRAFDGGVASLMPLCDGATALY